MTMNRAKMAEPIEMPYEVLTYVGPRFHILDMDPDPLWEGEVLGNICLPIVKYSSYLAPQYGYNIHASCCSGHYTARAHRGQLHSPPRGLWCGLFPNYFGQCCCGSYCTFISVYYSTATSILGHQPTSGRHVELRCPSLGACNTWSAFCRIVTYGSWHEGMLWLS